MGWEESNSEAWRDAFMAAVTDAAERRGEPIPDGVAARIWDAPVVRDTADVDGWPGDTACVHVGRVCDCDYQADR